MGIGTRIKSVLRERKQTIKQLAEITDIPVNTLYSITKRDSERVDSIILNRIATALNVDENWLRNGKTLMQRDQEMKDTVARLQEEGAIDTKLFSAYEMLTTEAKAKLANYAQDLLLVPQYRLSDAANAEPAPETE